MRVALESDGNQAGVAVLDMVLGVTCRFAFPWF